MKNLTINSGLKILIFFVALLSLNAKCKKDLFEPENNETYFRGTVGGIPIDFKTSFFYAEDGYVIYEGVGKIFDNNVGITLSRTDDEGSTAPDGSGNRIYGYDVDAHTEKRYASAILVLVNTNNPVASGVSYYENCNGRTMNSPESIAIGKIEKVGNKEYVKGSFDGTVYYNASGSCTPVSERMSIQFRVQKRN